MPGGLGATLVILAGCARGEPIADELAIVPSETGSATPPVSLDAEASDEGTGRTGADLAADSGAELSQEPAAYAPVQAPPAMASAESAQSDVSPSDEVPTQTPPVDDAPEDETPGAEPQDSEPQDSEPQDVDEPNPPLPPPSEPPPSGVPAPPPPSGLPEVLNLIDNSDFEVGVEGWSALFGGTLSATTSQSNGGAQSALVSGRTETWQGPFVDVTALVLPGQLYTVGIFARIGGAAQAPLVLTGRIGCADQDEQFVTITTGEASSAAWTALRGTLAVPPATGCELSNLVLYVEGPPAQVDLLVDDASLALLD